MNVLLVGGGGREHALAWALAASPRLTRLFIAPGNPGTAACGSNVVLDVADHAAVVAFCRLMAIGLVVVGPEAPLAAGLADALAAASVPVFGPGRAAAQLESSKGFTKDLCRAHGIPTAAYERFTDRADALAFVRRQGAPIVVKQDGLAAGKGVVVAMTLADAEAAVDALLSDGASVVIEAYLTGEEASYFCLVDGETVLPFGSAQDHKRVGEGDTGPNTGGMGAYSPAPVLTQALEEEVLARIIRPTVAAMAARGTPFRGVLFAGLMLTAEGPQLIEYNCRFGDPETEALMPRLATDLLPLLHATATGTLAGKVVQWRPEPAITVVLAARGYPGKPVTGGAIEGLEAAAEVPDVHIFHAGTQADGERLIATGGRVLAVSATAPTLAEARERAYAAVDRIRWADGFCRRDIAWRALRQPGGA
jgi:phosphoribosylamine--glycine ligase